LPGEGGYDRGERKELSREFRMWLAGCGIVVLILVFCFVVYAVLLIRSGWHG
jgi:hypothetical protein